MAFVQRAVHLWNNFSKVQYDPQRPGTLALWLINGGIVAVTIAVCILLPLQYDTLRPIQGVTPIWVVTTLVSSLLSSFVAIWALIRKPWRIAQPAEQVQGRMMIAILVVWMAFQSLGFIFEGLASGVALSIVAYVSSFLISIQAIWLTQRGHTRLGAVLPILSLWLNAFSTSAADSGIVLPILVYTITIVMGGMFVRRWVALVLPPLLPLLYPLVQAVGGNAVTDSDRLALLIAGILLMLLAMIIVLYVRAFDSNLNAMEARTRDLEAAQSALQAQNALLVDQATSLQDARASLQRQVETQETQIAEAVAALRQQSIEIGSLQTPLIRVAPQVIVAPLIGTWNSDRVSVFRDTMLKGIEQQRARVAVFDLTGITAADQVVAEMLEQTMAAARLLGCVCILVGIQPEMAQTLVNLQRNLSDVHTAADLAAGIRWALRRLGSPLLI